MTGALASRTARRRGIAYAILLAVSLGLMAVSSNPLVQEVQRGVVFAFRPFEAALDEVARGVGSVASAISEIDRLRIENQTLAEENLRLEAENARLEEFGRENEQLTALLQLRSGLDFETVAAQVIARESAEFRRVVTIDRGSDEGIAAQDVVIAAGGALAGRVLDVGPNFARVLLMNDTSSTVVGELTTSSATGEVIGQLGGVLIMRNIDSTVRIQLGEEVVTAGIELGGGVRSPYPKGLIIGQVVDVQRDANDVVQTAFLVPTAPLESIGYVLVITDYVGGLPPPEQLPTECLPGEGSETLPEGEQPCFTPTPPPALPTPTPTP